MLAQITDKKAFVSELLLRLRGRVRETGESEKQFARRLGSSDALFKNLESGSLPSADRLMVLLNEIGETVVLGAEREVSRFGQFEPVQVDGSDYARIPLHDAWLSAGPGVENGDVAIIDHLVFRQEWLRKIDVKPEAAAMARVSGDSMAPGIQSGDLVMIDTTRREVPVHKKNRLPTRLPIFAFMQDSEARVKRLERRPKEQILVLYSDNKDMPPELIAESDAHVLNILGQVVWSGHVWR